MLGRAMVDATESTDADRDRYVNNNNSNNNNNALFGENFSPNRLGGDGDGDGGRGGGDSSDLYGDWTTEGWSGLPSDGDFFKNLKFDEQPWLYPDDDNNGGVNAPASSSSALNFLAGLRDDVLPPPPPFPNTQASTHSMNASMEI